MSRRLLVTGSTLRPRPVEFKAAIRAALLERVWPLVEAGAVRPVVDRVFALEEAAAAHAHMERGAHMGKILLRVQAGM
jgi:NADPH2:quinone reductase